MPRDVDYRYCVEGEHLTSGEVADRVASLAPKLKRNTVINRLVRHGLRTWAQLSAPLSILRKGRLANGKKINRRMFGGGE